VPSSTYRFPTRRVTDLALAAVQRTCADAAREDLFLHFTSSGAAFSLRERTVGGSRRCAPMNSRVERRLAEARVTAAPAGLAIRF
jgi:hypothetical protein